MIQTLNTTTVKEAMQYLHEHDTMLAPIIDRVGICTITPHKEYYRALVSSIVSQQLSVKAASSIFARLLSLFNESFPTPEQLLEKSIDELKGVGLSRPKANYIHDLAQHILDGDITFDDLDSLDNAAIIKKLTDVKGIGEWTVHMFLMFSMGRTDVLAYGDLGIRNAAYRLYSLSTLPTKEDLEKISLQNRWHPYESVACWYLWQSLDTAPAL